MRTAILIILVSAVIATAVTCGMWLIIFPPDSQNRLEVHYVDKDESNGEVSVSGYYIKWIIFDADGTQGHIASSSIWETKSVAIGKAKQLRPCGWECYDMTLKNPKPF